MRWMRRLLCLYCLCLLAACEKAKQDMYDQPKYKPFKRSELFADGNSSRPLPQDSVPYSAGPFAGTSSGRIGAGHVGEAMAASAAKTNPYPVDMQLLKRGQERFEIYCMPCHGPVGDGDGLVARRGFPHPPSYHIDRLRLAPDRHFFDVMTNGYGIMYSYADRVEPPDRWAIVAYIRALQLSQHAEVKDLPPEARQRLDALSALPTEDYPQIGKTAVAPSPSRERPGWGWVSILMGSAFETHPHPNPPLEGEGTSRFGQIMGNPEALPEGGR